MSLVWAARLWTVWRGARAIVGELVVRPLAWPFHVVRLLARRIALAIEWLADRIGGWPV